MRRNKVCKLVGLMVLGGTLFGGGCSFGNLGRQVYIGFGRSLGAIPSQLLQDMFLTGFIDSLTGTTTGT